MDLENNCVVQEFESITDLNSWDNIKLVSRDHFVDIKLCFILMMILQSFGVRYVGKN